jgi:hypothetical protein
MSMLSSFLHPERGYQKAEDVMKNYFNQAQGFYNQGQNYLQPYVNQGQSQFDRLNQQENALGNPAELENQWASQYTESPYAQQLQKEAAVRGNEEAASMGLSGSSAALGNVQTGATNIMNADRQNYMNDLMQKYMQSIGIGQNLYGVGAGAAGQQAGNAMNWGNNVINQGNNIAQAEYGQTNAPGDLFGKFAGVGANSLINYLTGRLAGGAKSTTPNLPNPFSMQ